MTNIEESQTKKDCSIREKLKRRDKKIESEKRIKRYGHLEKG